MVTSLHFKSSILTVTSNLLILVQFIIKIFKNEDLIGFSKTSVTFGIIFPNKFIYVSLFDIDVTYNQWWNAGAFMNVTQYWPHLMFRTPE